MAFGVYPDANKYRRGIPQSSYPMLQQEQAPAPMVSGPRSTFNVPATAAMQMAGSPARMTSAPLPMLNPGTVSQNVSPAPLPSGNRPAPLLPSSPLMTNINRARDAARYAGDAANKPLPMMPGGLITAPTLGIEKRPGLNQVTGEQVPAYTPTQWSDIQGRRREYATTKTREADQLQSAYDKANTPPEQPQLPDPPSVAAAKINQAGQTERAKMTATSRIDALEKTIKELQEQLKGGNPAAGKQLNESEAIAAGEVGYGGVLAMRRGIEPGSPTTQPSAIANVPPLTGGTQTTIGGGQVVQPQQQAGKQYAHYATGPNGERVGSNDGVNWVPVAPLQSRGPTTQPVGVQ